MDQVIPYGIIYNKENTVIFGDIHDFYFNCYNVYNCREAFNDVDILVKRVADYVYQFAKCMVLKKELNSKWLEIFPINITAKSLKAYVVKVIIAYCRRFLGLLRENKPFCFTPDVYETPVSSMPVRLSEKGVSWLDYQFNLMEVLKKLERMADKDFARMVEFLNAASKTLVMQGLIVEKKRPMLNGERSEMPAYAQQVIIWLLQNVLDYHEKRRGTEFPYGFVLSEWRANGDIHDLYFNCQHIGENLNDENFDHFYKIIGIFVEFLISMKELSKAWKIECGKGLREYLKKFNVAYRQMFSANISDQLINRTPNNSNIFPLYFGREQKPTPEIYYQNLIVILRNLRFRPDDAYGPVCNFLGTCQFVFPQLEKFNYSKKTEYTEICDYIIKAIKHYLLAN